MIDDFMPNQISTACKKSFSRLSCTALHLFKFIHFIAGALVYSQDTECTAF